MHSYLSAVVNSEYRVLGTIIKFCSIPQHHVPTHSLYPVRSFFVWIFNYNINYLDIILTKPTIASKKFNVMYDQINYLFQLSYVILFLNILLMKLLMFLRMLHNCQREEFLISFKLWKKKNTTKMCLFPLTVSCHLCTIFWLHDYKT